MMKFVMYPILWFTPARLGSFSEHTATQCRMPYQNLILLL